MPSPSPTPSWAPPLLVAVVSMVACNRGEAESAPPPPRPQIAADAGRGEDGDLRPGAGDDGGQDGGGQSSNGETGSAVDAAVEASPLDRVRAAAEAMLADADGARWGRSGRLGPEQLTCDYATVSDQGVEVFSVLDADGFEGHHKCNLFAFELLYRAGLLVPVISRVRGWTYPGPLCVTHMVEGDEVAGGWAISPGDLSAEGLSAAASSGRVFLVAGSGTRGRSGHLGVVEDVHRIERDRAGRITSLDYTGWEANADRARHRRRSWESSRLGRIQIAELLLPAPGARQVVVVGPPPDEPSLADRERLSSSALAAAAHNPRGGDMGAWPGGTRIPEHGPPRLPVVHRLLGSGSVFGPVLDVDHVVADDGQAAAEAVSKTRVTGRPGIDVDRVLEGGSN